MTKGARLVDYVSGRTSPKCRIGMKNIATEKQVFYSSKGNESPIYVEALHRKTQQIESNKIVGERQWARS